MSHENDDIPVDKLVHVFLSMRDKLAEHNRNAKAVAEGIKKKMRMVENELLRRSNIQGTEGFTTKEGTTYKAVEIHASIADDALFFDFLNEQNEPYDYFTRRVSLDAIKAYMDKHEGESPPGLNVFKENRMKVRVKNKRGAPTNEKEEASDDTSDD